MAESRPSIFGPSVTGGIVAGGASARMGRNKALLPFRGKPLVLHQRELLAPLFDRVVVAAADPAPFAPLGLEVVPDLLPERCSLTAVHAVLSATRSDHALVVACDLPFLNVDLLRHLLDRRAGADVVVPEVDGRLEPLHAVYSRACLPVLEDSARRGVWKADAWFPAVRCIRVPVTPGDWLVDGRSPFFNANTPADWDAAAR